MNPKSMTKNYERTFSSSRKKRKDDVSLWINSTFRFLTIFIAWLFIYYVWILNVNATQWYEIRTLELEKQNLLLQQELLDVKIAKLESLNNIKKEDTDLMEKIESPKYAIIKNWVSYAFNN